MGETRNAYRILVGKPEGKRPLGRPKRTWVGNIKIDLREREHGLVWTGSTDRQRSGGAKSFAAFGCQCAIKMKHVYFFP
jgi:hypothetical protein